CDRFRPPQRMNAQTLNSSAPPPHRKVSSATLHASPAPRLITVETSSGDIGHGIDVGTVLHDLEVQMTAGRGSRRAGDRDDIALLDFLTGVDLDLRVVIVGRGDRAAIDLAVGDHDPVAIAACPPGTDDDSISGSTD